LGLVLFEKDLHREGVGKREFPVSEIFKTEGFEKERERRHDPSPATNKQNKPFGACFV